VAVDASPTNWLAFREPAEIGWASALADSIIQNSRELGLAVLALTVLALGYARSNEPVGNGRPEHRSIDDRKYAPAE
jgi:hypothetical protein